MANEDLTAGAALGQGAAGAATGFIASGGNPLGAIIGGLVGAGSSLLMSGLEGEAMKREAEEARALQERQFALQDEQRAFQDEMQDKRFDLGRQQFEQQREMAEGQMEEQRQDFTQEGLRGFLGRGSAQQASKDIARRVDQLGLRG